MAKKNRNGNATIDITGKKNVVDIITASRNKHGEIRGENKKETKNLKAICTHHYRNKKGKIKAAIINDGNGICTCELCGHRFPTKLYQKDDVDKQVGKVRELVDQSKFMVQSADLGKEGLHYLCTLSTYLTKFPKYYGKVKHTVEKSENTKKRKNKNRNSNSGSESYGGWR